MFVIFLATNDIAWKDLYCTKTGILVQKIANFFRCVAQLFETLFKYQGLQHGIVHGNIVIFVQYVKSLGLKIFFELR